MWATKMIQNCRSCKELLKTQVHNNLKKTPSENDKGTNSLSWELINQMSAASIYPTFLSWVILLGNYIGDEEKCVFIKIAEIRNENEMIELENTIL